MKKIILTIALLFAFAGGLKAQTVETFENFDGVSFGFYNGDVDSVETINSGYFDVSLVDNQPLYLTYLFGAGTGGGTITNDSVTLIIQSRTPYKTSPSATSFSYLTRNVDTLIIVGGTAPSFTTLSLTSYGPEIRFNLVTVDGGTGTANQNNRTIALCLYARALDRAPFMRKHYGNLDR